MQIAQVVGNKIVKLDHYTKVFPDTSFPNTGPDDEFLTQNGCMRVRLTKPYSENQRLVECDPYVEDGFVYRVRVEDRSPEELEGAKLDSAKSTRVADLSELTVEMFGHTFNADEQSQMRMGTTLAGMYEDSVVSWVTADRQIASLDSTQLKCLLNKAVEARTQIWIAPYL